MKLVYLSPVPWNSVAQRPHFFVKSAIRNGYTSVLWIDPTPSRLPKLVDLKTTISSVEADSIPKDSRIRVIKPRVIPIEPMHTLYKIINFASLKKIINEISDFSDEKDTVLVSGKPSILSICLLNNLHFRKTIVDVMDDFPFFFSGVSSASISRLLIDVIRHSDISIYSSTELFNKYGSNCTNKLLIKNACDRNFIDVVNSIRVKENKGKKGNLVFGYVGSIAKWFDWEAVMKLANDNPNSTVKLIGPNYSLSIPKLPNNIIIEPAIEHSKVASAITDFDYGLIPFKINSLTNSVDPVKYYEYLAAGVDIISTPFGEMKKRVENQQVYSFDNYNLGIECYNEEAVTWDERFEHLISILRR